MIEWSGDLEIYMVWQLVNPCKRVKTDIFNNWWLMIDNWWLLIDDDDAGNSKPFNQKDS